MSKTVDFAVERLLNFGGAGEGFTFLPRLQGGFRVPVVTNLRLEGVKYEDGEAVIKLSWIIPPDDADIISHYNVYVRGLNGIESYQGPFASVHPPAIIRVRSSVKAQIRLVVQTVLKGGYTSDLSLSPSVSVLISSYRESSYFPIRKYTSNITLSEERTILLDATAGNITATLPYSKSFIGRKYEIRRIDGSANTVTLAALTGDTINGTTSVPLNSSFPIARPIATPEDGWWTF